MEPHATAPPYRDIYSVSRLNREAKALLEDSFPPLWVEGEISNLARPASGHAYFTLKDAQCQVRCALFRQHQRLLGLTLKDGVHVLARVRVSLYEGRGEFQLIVEYLEAAGEGALKRAFDALKLRLAQEGLFDSAHKRPLPRLPRRIGLITSPSGAVVHDVLTTLQRRFPAIAVRLYPVPVQGEGAAEKIAAALRFAGAQGDCDALILARGGGSLEDLWAFNEEIVARAIYACPIPVVSGVGHETDFTIADLAADARAPTPTAAAELLSPDQGDWLAQYQALETRLARLIRDRLRNASQHLDWLSARLIHPRERIELLKQRQIGLTQRLFLAEVTGRRQQGHLLQTLTARLKQHSPFPRIAHEQLNARHLAQRLHHALHRHLQHRHEQLQQIAHTLHALSPLATLERGYAIVLGPDGAVVRHARAIQPGQPVTAKLGRGSLECRVEKCREN